MLLHTSSCAVVALERFDRLSGARDSANTHYNGLELEKWSTKTSHIEPNNHPFCLDLFVSLLEKTIRKRAVEVVVDLVVCASRIHH